MDRSLLAAGDENMQFINNPQWVGDNPSDAPSISQAGLNLPDETSNLNGISSTNYNSRNKLKPNSV